MAYAHPPPLFGTYVDVIVLETWSLMTSIGNPSLAPSSSSMPGVVMPAAGGLDDLDGIGGCACRAVTHHWLLAKKKKKKKLLDL